MTHSTRWIACRITVSFPLLMAGCNSGLKPATPAEVRAVLSETLMASEFDVKTASALQQLEQSNSAAADAIRAIGIARDVCLNDLHNAGTLAFKGTRAVLQGGGKVYTQQDFSHGPVQSTGRTFDLAIQGPGFFKVIIRDEVGDGVGYTRGGNFFVNDKGTLVRGMGDGYALFPAITVPTGMTDISVSTDGVISGVNANSSRKQNLGQIMLTQFVNREGLNVLKSSIYTETDASGRPVETKPGSGGSGAILQGFLEGSNVDIDREMIRLHFLNQWRSTLLRAIGMHD